MSTDRFEEFDAAYVLGALSASEQAEFELHLETCSECRTRVDEVMGLPVLLSELPAAAFAVADPPPPEGLLLSLQREVRRIRNRRRWIYTVGTAAAAVVLIVATTLIVRPHSAATPTPTATVAAFRPMTNPSGAPLDVDAAVTTVGWGTRIDLRCTYDPSVTAGEYRYSLVVVDSAGTAYDAGSWKAVPGKVTRFTGGSALPVSDIAQIQITMTGTTGPLLTLAP